MHGQIACALKVMLLSIINRNYFPNVRVILFLISKLKMTRYFPYCIVVSVTFLVTGCGIGGMWMNGNPFPTPVKPYLEYWEKPGMTTDSRMQVSASCGGGLSDRPEPSQQQIKKFQKSDENNGQTFARLFRDWERCMIKNGYSFKGECYDNEISRSKPACGAP